MDQVGKSVISMSFLVVVDCYCSALLYILGFYIKIELMFYSI
ncbi:putative membrane protein [Ehrlichia chaffeensis str. Heartland]|nr:putative membrane protein [Ehrlichia chaffeensis str. Heartland]AHX10224.1 putative membrane protein [Ehrlichia chaffeensis str. West Paces]